MQPRLHLGRLSLDKVDPIRAEIEVSVAIESPPPDYQLRCRLVGPHCAFASTVEVGYALREKTRTALTAHDGLTGVSVVFEAALPEPNYWDPQSPFLYHCFAELWQGTQRQAKSDVWYGLRRIDLGRQGLLINDQPVAFRGGQQSDFTEDKAAAWRRQGLNLVVADVGASSPTVWDIASRTGFCVLGRFNSTEEKHLQIHERLQDAGALGWIVPGDEAADPQYTMGVRRIANSSNQLLGVETGRPLAAAMQDAYDFVLCPLEALPELAEVQLPKMVLVDELPADPRQEAASEHRVIAWIQR
jgi:hypothetical protein